MANISLDLSSFKASGIYTIESESEPSVVLNTQTTRLVVGFSKVGPINAPVFCPDVKTARQIFGDIDKDLENKGSYFHRSLFTCLEVGPCFAIALLPLNDDETTSNTDYDTYSSFSLSTSETNGIVQKSLYSSFFNKERFYFPDTEYFLANVNSTTSLNKGKLLNFVNLSQKPCTIVVRKTGDLTGFNVTARDWFGSGKVPSFVKEFDYISDYFVNIDIIEGDWTDYGRLSTDPIYSTYFNSKGIIKASYLNFLASPNVNVSASFQGSVIPDLTDNNNINYSIDTIVNANIATTGIFCALDRAALADYDSTDLSSTGRVDMIGHNILQQNPDTVNFLSYSFAAKESINYTLQSTHSALNNTFIYDFGTGATANLPGGLGSTGASYSALANGYNANNPNKVAYFESYYSTGNSGKFNNVLCLRKEAFSAEQYVILQNLLEGSSLIVDPVGATFNATVTSVNEVLIGSDTVLKLGISQPAKSLEGSTTGKNATVIANDSTTITVSGTQASTDLKEGDWIFAEYAGSRYYFRVVSATTDSTNSTITVDTTNSIFGGATNITSINTFFVVYWEATTSGGSLFDVIEYGSSIAALTVIKRPNLFAHFTSYKGGSNAYVGYEFSPLYQNFKNGIISDSDIVYIAGPTPLYIQASYENDVDALTTLVLRPYLNQQLTIGYTGSWTFASVKSDTGATISGNPLRIYSAVGDYALSIGATGFNSTMTSCYILATDASKIQVGQYVVSDPLNTNNSSDFVLSRVVSKRLVSSGTYIGYYLITSSQRMVNYSGDILRYKTIDQASTNYQGTFLKGFSLTSYHLPDGSNSQLAKILGLLDPSASNLYDSLSSKHMITYRYIIDTFDGGLAQYSYPKNLITKLAKNRQKCMAIMNAPSITKFKSSTDPRFTDAPTNSNPLPLLNTSYIAAGGNLSLGPSFEYSLPDEDNGAKFAGFFSPFLKLRENNKNFSVPPAADVSNNFIRKFVNGQPYSIVAGPRRGILSNPKLVGLEYDFSDKDRSNLEPIGWNPIVYRKGSGFMIHGNQSAYQNVPSAFNSLHVRDLLITVEESIEDILFNFIYEFNDSSTRLQIKSIVDSYLDTVRSAGGIGTFSTKMDDKNNTPDIISSSFAIIDVSIEPAMGAQKFINRIKVFKTGGISSGGFAAA